MAETKNHLLQRLALQGLCLILLFGLGHSSQSPGWVSNGHSVQQQQYEETSTPGATWSSNHHSDTSDVGTIASTARHRGSQQAPLLVPEITTSQIASALRLTCEINRRLSLGSSAGRQVKLVTDPQDHQIPAATPGMELSEPLTIFHQVEPRTGETPLRDIERWGPDLQSYTRQIVDLLELPNEDIPFILTLTMMYLDRASSVETPRSNGAPPCPFSTARTVHRLFLSAMIVSTQVVSGQSLSQIYEKLQSVGIPAWEMDEMQTWMRVALGDAGYFVSGYEMLKFKQTWESIFNNQQPQPHPTEQNYQQQKSTNTREDVQEAPSGFFSSSQPLSATAVSQENAGSPSDNRSSFASQKASSEKTQSTGFSQPAAFHKNRVSVHSG